MASFSDEQDRARDGANAVVSLVTALAVVAVMTLVLSGHAIVSAVAERPGTFAVFLAVCVGLQFFAIPVYGRGSIGVSGIGLLGAAFVLGPGPGAAIAATTALSQWARRRAPLHKGMFDIANLALSTAIAGWLYHGFDGSHRSALVQLVVGTAAGVLWSAVNMALLAVVMSTAEHVPIVDVWRERFKWAWMFFGAFGPIAVAATIAFWRVGWPGLVAFALPPAILVFSIRQYVHRTTESVAAAREARDELRRTAAELAEREAELGELLNFTTELASRAHDLAEVRAYAEYALTVLVGTTVTVTLGKGDGIALRAGQEQVGTVKLSTSGRFDGPRWERLRDVVLPQLALAIASARAAERSRVLA